MTANWDWIKYVMALMNGARLGIAAQSVGVEQEAYNEGLAYERACTVWQEDHHIPGCLRYAFTYEGKLDAGVVLFYQTARFVDIYKALEDISREQLTPEERQEMKKFRGLADAFTPLAKGMNSEYANQCLRCHLHPRRFRFHHGVQESASVP